MLDKQYDVVVIGGGHAGVEAACAAARMGCQTALITHNIDTIGQMSCNPAIGGIGKTHLVKEIDALGGVMAWAADQAAIHIRVLNESKGPAVRALRMQADRTRYRKAVRHAVENTPGLDLFQQPVDDLLIENGVVTGVVTQLGIVIRSRSVVLTVGTFLAGQIHVGDKRTSGGRVGDAAAVRLSDRLRELQLPVGRLKTGTPPRIDGRSIDYDQLTAQPSDYPEMLMRYYPREPIDHPPQVDCWITRTTPRTHEIILDNLSKSAVHCGHIEGVGPRYCPSIEDKVVRFRDRSHHQVFIEPEGLDTHEVYPNGISTSLPFAVQLEFVRSITGLAHAHITRPGYAIEYDFFDPRSLTSALAVKDLPGLFFAGQINGTTGYEEAGAQGLLAGINAALLVQGRELWSPGRDEAYIGVLVDDLITKGAPEPYRMFTSRAEYRLSLRQDNADQRLTEIGYRLGVVSAARHQAWLEKKERIVQAEQQLKSWALKPGTAAYQAYLDQGHAALPSGGRLSELLLRPAHDYQSLVALDPGWLAESERRSDVIEQINIQAQYAGYLPRQLAAIKKQKKYEGLVILPEFDYDTVIGLSNEVRGVLKQCRPGTLGQASRVPGVTPAAVALLMVYLQRGQVSGQKEVVIEDA